MTTAMRVSVSSLALANSTGDRFILEKSCSTPLLLAVHAMKAPRTLDNASEVPYLSFNLFVDVVLSTAAFHAARLQLPCLNNAWATAMVITYL